MLGRVFSLFAVAATVVLGGCATHWVVDSEVRSFSSFPADAVAAPGATYRFERLPSQQQGEGAVQQTEVLEAMAAPALEGAGLQRNDASPRFSAQIGARVSLAISPWDDPWRYGGGWGWGPRSYAGVGVGGGRFNGRGWAGGGWGGGWYGAGGWYGPGFAPASASPWYLREVSIVLRDLGSNRVVYETSARNDGPHSSDAAVLPAMFRAALQGFPTPPQGERRVDIEVAPKSAK